MINQLTNREVQELSFEYYLLVIFYICKSVTFFEVSFLRENADAVSRLEPMIVKTVLATTPKITTVLSVWPNNERDKISHGIQYDYFFHNLKNC
jgi:hypothetical protein